MLKDVLGWILCLHSGAAGGGELDKFSYGRRAFDGQNRNLFHDGEREGFTWRLRLSLPVSVQSCCSRPEREPNNPASNHPLQVATGAHPYLELK